ncbi:MAG: ThuA domain-containing protein [Deltaproteobacteria bacterium]|nr:ThuA domain-containing protein [Deltaproteobacteria bacterium]
MSRLKKFLLGTALALVLLVGVGLAMIHRSGAWFLLFPSRHHDTTPPELPADFGAGKSLRVLVFSKTNSFRHEDGIAGARRALDAIAERRGWALFHSENGALFSAPGLARFDVVVFSNASGDMLSDEQDRAFEAWLTAGGGWLGIHSAGDLSHAEWTWYRENLIGGNFIGHILGPQTQTARVIVEDRAHPVTQGLPAEFEHEEEWYSWDASPRTLGFHVLLTVDESSYDPAIRIFGSETSIRMGDHPVAWWRCVGSGRALYATMGHWARAYENVPYATLLENAVAWTGDRGACAPGASKDGAASGASATGTEPAPALGAPPPPMAGPAGEAAAAAAAEARGRASAAATAAATAED